MESENRPYVDPETEPGDSGTEDWADKNSGSGDPAGAEPKAEAIETDDDGVVEGSPAKEFINDPDAIGARDDEGDAS